MCAGETWVFQLRSEAKGLYCHPVDIISEAQYELRQKIIERIRKGERNGYCLYIVFFCT